MYGNSLQLLVLLTPISQVLEAYMLQHKKIHCLISKKGKKCHKGFCLQGLCLQLLVLGGFVTC